MSLLHQEVQDEAARGEELTKGTSHVVVATIVASLVVAAAIAAYFVTGQKPPPAAGQILDVWVHPLHSESSGYDASGAMVPKESLDEVMVFTHVRLRNQSKGPLFLWNIVTNATLPDGIHSSYAATSMDYERIFAAYPDLKAPHGVPLRIGTEIDPGQTVDGDFVCAFKLNKQQWDAGKDLNFTFAFRYQPNLVLTPKVPITEQ